MALPGSGVVNRGLQITGGLTWNTADAFAVVQSISIDDSSANFLATDTALNSSRAPTVVSAVSFDSVPTRTAQTITAQSTFGTGLFNGHTVGGIGVHNIAGGSVTLSSNTLFAGIAGQSIAKTNQFSLTVIVACLYTDAS